MAIGRNDPCPCGSGKKHKKCCLDTAPAERKTIPAAPSPREQLDMAKAALGRGSFDVARRLIKPLLKEKATEGSVWLLASGIEMQDKKF